jgi:phosphoribosylformylglycinamidine synthase
VNDNFCVPDSEYHPQSNPDGKLKLAKLVQMCEALYDMATYFDIPLTSGKDSMKNDFKADGVKISVPPTILYSMTAKMDDVRSGITSDFKSAGDLIYQLGESYDELGASEFYRLFNALGAKVPKVRKEKAKALYLKVMEANAAQLIESSHDLSDGGLAVALAESAFGSGLGAKIDLNVLNNLPLHVQLFSESHSRFIVSVRPENQDRFEAVLGDRAFLIGTVQQEQQLSINNCIDLSLHELEDAWSNVLVL